MRMLRRLSALKARHDHRAWLAALAPMSDWHLLLTLRFETMAALRRMRR